jgi:hypothetical protein
MLEQKVTENASSRSNSKVKNLRPKTAYAPHQRNQSDIHFLLKKDSSNEKQPSSGEDAASNWD